MVEWLMYIVLGAGLGTLGGLFGIGGGLIAIPVLGVLFGLDQQLAQGTALVMVVPNVLLALWRYHQRNRIELRHALPLSLAGFVFAWLGSIWAVGLDAQAMRVGFVVFLVALTVWNLVRNAFQAGATRVTLDLRVGWTPSVTVAGATVWQLTWQDGVAIARDRDTLAERGRAGYDGEGWGLCAQDDRLVMSDGTDQIRFIDPDTFAETGRIAVTADGRPLDQINELEWVDGEIYANVWLTDRIARIDPETGVVKAFIDLSALVPRGIGLDPNDDVLNGIAWDAAGKRLFVTGKRWPQLFEIKLR